jgi:dipeptidyl aminopeptidase/acylaminoacyl peptidase
MSIQPASGKWIASRLIVAAFLMILFLRTDTGGAQNKDKGAGPPGPGIPGQKGRKGAVAPIPSQFWCATFSPDGKAVAAVAGLLETAGQAVVWDLPSGKMRFQHPEKLGVRSVAFSPDGKTLAIALYEGTVKLLDPATGQEKSVLRGHTKGVNCVAFSPDGKTLATASLDTTAKLWDVATGKEMKTLRGHTEYVLCVAFSPDGQMLATASGASHNAERGGNAKLWDVATGKERTTLGGFTRPVEFVTFSPDGKTVATASWDGSVRLWDAAGQSHTTLLSNAIGTTAVRYSPDGKLLAAAIGSPNSGPSEVKIWETATNRELADLKHPSNVWSVEFSPDGRSLVTSCWDNTVKLWELATHKERATFQAIPGSPQRQQGALSAQQLDTLWNDLAGTDAFRAYRAIGTLAGSGKEAVPFLAERLKDLKPAKAAPPDADRIAKLIAQLDDDDFNLREKAHDELKKLGKAAEPALRRALEGAPSAEVDFRVKLLLENLSGLSSDSLAVVRAVEALEFLATPEAHEVLKTLAKEGSTDALKREAQSTLERLDKRAAKAP